MLLWLGTLTSQARPGEAIPISQNELGEAHRVRMADWRTSPPSSDESRAVLQRIETARQDLEVLDRALRRASPRDWRVARDHLDLTSLTSVADSLMTLTRSPELPREAREAIGWGWSFCGWRRCGAAADVEKALATLRSQWGMLTALEARYLVDVAKRGLDEILDLAYLAGLDGDDHDGEDGDGYRKRRSPGPPRQYLSSEDVSEVLENRFHFYDDYENVLLRLAPSGDGPYAS